MSAMTLKRLSGKIFTHGALRMSNRMSSTKSGQAKSLIDAKFQTVDVGKSENEQSWTIKLDQHLLKTPLKNPVKIPNETLAHAIANEWVTVPKQGKIDTSRMHLTTLVYTAIDNPCNESEEQMVESLLDYLSFDTIRYRATEPNDLFALQQQSWDPIIDWFEHAFKCYVPLEYGNLALSTPLPTQTYEKMTNHLSLFTRWPLVGMKFVAENLKSLILTSCLTERFLSVRDVVRLARLETQYQTDKWSTIESEHDLDEQIVCARVSAGTMFFHLTSSR